MLGALTLVKSISMNCLQFELHLHCNEKSKMSKVQNVRSFGKWTVLRKKTSLNKTLTWFSR